MVGLLAAPVAAAIAILVISALIANDPPALLSNGHANKLHVNVSTYHELAGVLLVMSVLMLVTSLLRKRVLMGIVMALFGLALFNLHYWGFGIPFLLGGAWLLVRGYRLSRDVRQATATGPDRPRPNKRYTAPAPRSPLSSKPRKDRRAR